MEKHYKRHNNNFDSCSCGLRKAGVKLTHQRIEICREISGRTDHPDADAVFHAVRQRMPTISLDTVYRTVSTLINLGLIGTLDVAGESARFDNNIDPHHHFICNRCGEAYDFQSEELDNIVLPEEVKALGTVLDTRIQARGICFECAKKDQH